MEKNVVVFDENGNQAGLTYPKRAKGLVKSGRAELLSDGAIRLKAPSAADTERTRRMNKEENEITELGKKIDEAVKKAEETMPKGPAADAAEERVDINEISREVSALMASQASQMERLMEVLEKADFDYKVDAVKAMADAVRETTNEALGVYKAAILGLADVGAAIKNASVNPDNAQFVCGMTQSYRQTVEEISRPNDVSE